MKRISWFFSIVFILFSVPICFSQDAIIEINSSELGVHRRPIVIFPHMKHEQVIECIRCHHDYDKFGNNLGGEGQTCSECHLKSTRSTPIHLKKAFHLLCKGCHQEIAQKNSPEKPLMCGQCHARQKCSFLIRTDQTTVKYNGE